ncbi:thioredoxin-dependent thiol peroxidase [Halovivax gelatinilyticus]|uniref:thioredoxin-dependent thiol peroxidase n=1 Tax=Halovivax gelatinilyticus TaxID=2961597 RepID=UPI0020CA4C2D|nr:thioredoxin-dependent thiol peroxidase [Halovivax gelatinilyticus]
MLEPGDDAPAFELSNQHGETVSLSEFSGQPVVVYFYPRANTEGCTVQACEFRDASSDLDRLDAEVVGISDDPVEDLASFAEDYDLEFHLLSDEDGSVSAAYDSYGEKQMFGNTFDGVFRNTYVVDEDGTIAAVFEGVTPEGHADEVLAALKR